MTFLTFSDFAKGDDITWIGGAVGNWSDTGAWSGAAVPTYADNVIFDSIATVSVSVDDTGYEINNLDFQGNTASVTLAGNTLILDGNVANTGNLGHNFTNTLELSVGVAHVIDTGSGSLVFLNAIALQGAAGFEKIGTGTIYLSATSHTGITLLTAGTIELDNKSSLKYSTLDTTPGTGNIVFKAGGSGTTGQYTFGGLQGSLDLRVDSADNVGGTTGNRDLAVGFNNLNTSYSGVLSGDCDFSKVGTGTLTYTGASTYTGVTAISGGTLSINSIKSVNGGSSAVGAPTNSTNGTIAIGSLTTGAKLIYTGGAQTTDRVINLAGTTGGATIDQSGSGLLKFTSDLTATGVGAKTLTLQGGASGTGEIAGAIVNSGSATSLTKADIGTWTLSGTNTYTGVTKISAGTLSVGTLADGGQNSSIGASANAAANLVFDGGTLQYTGSSVSSDRAFSINNTKVGTIDVVTSNLTISGSNATTTSGSLTKIGTGTLTLTGSNAYSGATLVSAGVLNIRNATALGTTAGGTSVTSGAALQIQGGFTEAEAALTLNGTAVTGESNTGALRNISDTNVWQGTVTLGSDSRINSDAGSLTFNTAANSITGTNKNLILGGASGGSVGGTITTGTGSLTKDGAGTWTLSGTNSYTGNTSVNGGTLQLGDGTTTGKLATTSNISIATGANLKFNPTSATPTVQGTDFNSLISGSGAVIQAGGTVELNGTNTYSGGTTVNAGGTLKVNNNPLTGSGTGSGAVIIDSGATLMGTGKLEGNVTINGIHAPGNSPGIETITGDLTYGSTSVFQWELGSSTQTQSGTSPSAFDQVAMSSGKTLTIVDGAKINLIFNSAASGDFLGSTVKFSDIFWSSSHSWQIFTGHGDVTGNFTIGTYSLDTATTPAAYTTAIPGGSFSMNGDTLNWTAVPEPSSALAGLLLCAGLLRRRR